MVGFDADDAPDATGDFVGEGEGAVGHGDASDDASDATVSLVGYIDGDFF